MQVVLLEEEVGPLRHHGFDLSVIEEFVQESDVRQSLQSAALIPLFNYLQRFLITWNSGLTFVKRRKISTATPLCSKVEMRLFSAKKTASSKCIGKFHRSPCSDASRSCFSPNGKLSSDLRGWRIRSTSSKSITPSRNRPKILISSLAWDV